MAVRVSPVPVIGLRDPLLTVTAGVGPLIPEFEPFHTNVEPGSCEKVNVIVAVWPAFRVVRSLVMVTVGCALPLIAISFVLLAMFSFPAKSVYFLLPTVMDALLLGALVEAVNCAVRMRPVPEMAERLPPETEISPEVPSHTNDVPGSSRKTKVIFVVSSAIKEVFSLSMVSGVSRVYALKGEANVLTSESNVGFDMSLPQETIEPSSRWAVKPL